MPACFSRLWKVAAAECRWTAKHPVEWITCALLPALWCLIVAFTFGTGQMSRIPVGLVNLDGAALSRSTVMALEAIPSIGLQGFTNLHEAETALSSAQTYGTLIIPEHFTRDSLNGRGATLELKINKSYYAVGTILEVDIKNALAAQKVTSGVMLMTAAHGGTFEANAGRLRIQFPDTAFLGNQGFNFIAYLLPTLIPGLLGLGAGIAFAGVLVREWRDGGLTEMMQAAGGSTFALFVGKLLPWVSYYSLLGLCWVAGFAGWAGWTQAGSIALWMLATVVFVWAMAGLAMFLVAFSITWVIGVTAVICFVAPTFPFTGFSYPLEAMTPGARFFGELLPLTHYLRIQGECWVLGSPLSTVLTQIGILALFAVIPTALAIPALRLRANGCLKLEAEARRLFRAARKTGEFRKDRAAFHFRTFWQTFFDALRGAVLNRDTLVVCVGAVAFYLVFYAWPYSNQQIEHVPVAVVDQDCSPTSRRLVSMIDASAVTDLQFVTADEGEAFARFQRDEIPVIITIPKDYERDLARGSNTSVHLLGNGAYPVKTRAMQAALAGVVQDSNPKLDNAAVFSTGLPGTSVSGASARAPGLIVQYRYNEIGGYGNYTVPVVGPVILQAVMLMAITMAVGGWLVSVNRPDFSRGALRYPLRLGSAVFLAFWVLAFLWFVYMQGFDFWVHEYGSMSNPWPVFFAGALFAGDVTAFALLIALLLGSNSWSSQAVVMISAPAVFLSGAIWPVQNILNPAVFGLSMLLPSTPGIRSIVALSQDGTPVSAVMNDLWLMFVQMLAYLLLAAFVSRYRLLTKPRDGFAGWYLN